MSDLTDLLTFAPAICAETRLRIRVSLAAYAYEFDHEIMSDADFDHLARQVDVSKATGRPDLDIWFRKNYSTDTGMWIRRHPELEQMKRLYESLKHHFHGAAPTQTERTDLLELLV